MNSIYSEYIADWYIAYLIDTEYNKQYPIALPPGTLIFIADKEALSLIDQDDIEDDYFILNQHKQVLRAKIKIPITNLKLYHLSLYKQYGICVRMGTRVTQHNGRSGILTQDIHAISTNNYMVSLIFGYVYITSSNILLGDIIDLKDCTYWKPVYT